MYKQVIRTISQAVSIILIGLIKGYQYIISPFLGDNCRFYPSCSSYSETALRRFGVIKGGYLTIVRLLRCHPFHPGGIDFPPESTCEGVIDGF